MCACADSLLLAPCNTWLCAVSSSLWCIWWPRCGTRATGGSVTFSRSLWSSNVILCGSCYAVSCLSGQYVEVQVNDMLSARGKQSSKVRRKFFCSQRTPRELTNHLTSRGGVLSCSVNSYSTQHAFSALAPVISHMVGLIARRLGPESNSRKQIESSCAVYTVPFFLSKFRLA